MNSIPEEFSEKSLDNLKVMLEEKYNKLKIMQIKAYYIITKITKKFIIRQKSISIKA